MSSSLPPQLPSALSALLSRPLPEPMKAAAGLAALAIDEAMNLPQRLASLPVSAAGQAMQASMRIQQRYAELVARGDHVISTLRGADDTPSWATFDEDSAPTSPSAAPPVVVAESPAGRGVGPGSAFDRQTDEVAPARRRARSAKSAAPAKRSTRAVRTTPAAPVEGYDDLTLPQLRARVKGYSQTQLTDLLGYENAGTARAPYVAMLTKRLAVVRRD